MDKSENKIFKQFNWHSISCVASALFSQCGFNYKNDLAISVYVCLNLCVCIFDFVCIFVHQCLYMGVYVCLRVTALKWYKSRESGIRFSRFILEAHRLQIISGNICLNILFTLKYLKINIILLNCEYLSSLRDFFS